MNESMLIGPQKFNPGTMVVTKGAMEAIGRTDYIRATLMMHVAGRWGLACAEDQKLNDEALELGNRVMSVWPMPKSDKNFWIITEADRSVTTVLLPEEY